MTIHYELSLLACRNFWSLATAFCRAEACRDKLAELNPYVTVAVCTDELTAATDLQFLDNYQVSQRSD